MKNQNQHDVACPYCGAGQNICHDDGYGYGGDTYSQECGECGETFTYTTETVFYYQVEKNAAIWKNTP